MADMKTEDKTKTEKPDTAATSTKKSDTSKAKKDTAQASKTDSE